MERGTSHTSAHHEAHCDVCHTHILFTCTIVHCCHFLINSSFLLIKCTQQEITLANRKQMHLLYRESKLNPMERVARFSAPPVLESLVSTRGVSWPQCRDSPPTELGLSPCILTLRHPRIHACGAWALARAWMPSTQLGSHGHLLQHTADG